MSRAGYILNWIREQDNSDEIETKTPKEGIKVKDFIKKEKQAALKRGEIVDDDPEVIDSDDDDLHKSAKVAHHIDRTSGVTRDNEIKNYAFPTKSEEK